MAKHALAMFSQLMRDFIHRMAESVSVINVNDIWVFFYVGVD